MKYILSPYVLRGHIPAAGGSPKTVFNYLNNRSYVISDMDFEVFKFCREPQEKSSIIKKFGQEEFVKLTSSSILLEYETMWSQNHASQIEIETSTVCNWKCEYCPVKYYTRKAEFIDLQVFDRIIDRAVEYGHIKYITLHSYNEPLLDNNFFYYLKRIEKTNLKLTLYTNASKLDMFKLDRLKDYKNLRNIVITFPSINPVTFKRMTGSNDYEKTVAAIQQILTMDINVSLSVQGLGGKAHMDEINAIKERFHGIQCTNHASFDRAGLLDNKYNQNIYVGEERLFGCRSYMEVVSVSIQGDVFLCCNDFHHNNKLGNLLEIPLHNLLSGPIATRYRCEIWGGVKAAADHICRNCYLMKHSFVNKKIW